MLIITITLLLQLWMIKVYVKCVCNMWFRLWAQVMWVKRKDLNFVLNVEYVEQSRVIGTALKIMISCWVSRL